MEISGFKGTIDVFRLIFEIHVGIRRICTRLQNFVPSARRTVLFVMAKTGRRPSPFGNEKWNGRPAQTMWREGLWREVFRQKMAGALPPIVLHSHTLTLIHTHIILLSPSSSHLYQHSIRHAPSNTTATVFIV